MSLWQKYKSNLSIIFVLTILLFVSGCWEFLSIKQPDLADPNSTFEVPINISLTEAEESGKGH